MMDPPLTNSAIGTHTPTSTTHKRTKSNLNPPSGPHLPTLFLTNLRLLNLDLLPDWPSITPVTFSNIDARARIKAAEWSLYQLFRLFDPALTADKLQPFFPPLEPLQSINLRAALYRCLDGLKKNGFLGREAVLRKTMLDECSGDKFWEVCVFFSAVVLRKKTLGRKPKSGLARSISQDLACAQGMGKPDREHLMPLLVAHKSSLGRTLAERQKLGEEFAQLEGVLGEKEADLARRRDELRRNGKNDMVEKQLDAFRPLEDTLRKKWVGDDGLKEALLSGGSAASSDRVLVQPTEALFDRSHASKQPDNGRRDSGIAEDIEIQARGQGLRLKRWQALYDRLQGAKPQPSAAEQAKARGGSVAIRFDKHTDLTLTDARQQRGGTSPTRSPTKGPHSSAASAVAGYDNILTAMREDLRRAQSTRRNVNTNSEDTRHSRSASDAVTGAYRPSARHASSHSRQDSRSPSLQYSPSQSPAPFRPGMNRRFSSRSRSYQQPKVISQRGPIPLKTELFSPLKSARSGAESPMSASTSRPGSALPTPLEEDGLGLGIDSSFGDYETRENSRSGELSRPPSRPLPALPSPRAERNEPAGSIDGRLGQFGDNSDFETTPKVDSAHSFALPVASASPLNLDPAKQDTLHEASEFKRPSLPPVRPSLADRTRQSMAFTSSENTRNIMSTPTREAPPSPAISTDAFPLPPSNITRSPLPTSPLERTPSLADRTRQSIPSFSPPTSVYQRPQLTSKHSRSRTDVSQQSSSSSQEQRHNTPKPRRSTSANLNVYQENTPQASASTIKRSVTPRDQLLEATDHESIFKSRPRVAHSPVVSPSVLDHEVEDFSMVGALDEFEREDVLGSSPLRR
ncbi:hypothetical protein Q7P37_005740 [Cladosporium fusiforme]